jgi:kinase
MDNKNGETALKELLLNPDPELKAHNFEEAKLHNSCHSNSNKESYTYNALEVLGSGSFGIVYKAECMETREIVAIKKVLQDKRYKNRELQLMKELDHPNVIKLKQSFYTPAENEDLYLNVVMEYIPDTLSKIIRNLYKTKTNFDMLTIKLYAFQLLKSINYIHALGICHRDIKPQNILIDPRNNLLKLCDFGSAKKLIKGDANVAYICSRYYRAPELIFSAEDYTAAVDIWSVGCVIAELILLEPVFPGESSTDQLVEIIKILGTPNRQQIRNMNPHYLQYKFPVIKCFTWKEVFKNKKIVTDDFIDFLSQILQYDPDKRISPLEALTHPFFDELKVERKLHKNSNFGKTPNEENTPRSNRIVLFPETLFEFSNEEFEQDRHELIKKIIPKWYLKDKTAINKF